MGVGVVCIHMCFVGGGGHGHQKLLSIRAASLKGCNKRGTSLCGFLKNQAKSCRLKGHLPPLHYAKC